MTNEMAVHQRNLESGILFMQKEHAQTLKALHEEIAKLQKKYSDATYRLTLQIPELNNAERERINKEQNEIMCDLQKERKHLVELNSRHEKKIKMLEKHIKIVDNRHSEDILAKDKIIDKLQSELKSKSNSVAQLLTELHKMKLNQRSNSLNSQSSGDSKLHEVHFDPSPPSSGAPKTRSYRKSENHASLVKHRPNVETGALVRSNMRSISDHHFHPKIPDPSPFLRRNSNDSTSSVEMCLRTTNPLPPIASRDSLDEKTSDYDVLFHSSCSPPSCTDPVPEVSTLELDSSAMASIPWKPSKEQSKSFELH